MSPNKANSGFTLIEVLIAMTLLGIMVVLLFSCMRISAESWQKGETKINQVNDTAVVYQFFQNHLTTALPLWDDFTDKENKVFAFQGESQKLQFVSSFPASAKKSGLQLFSLQLMKGDEGQYIQVSITPFFPSTKGDEWRKEEVTLLSHVSKFLLSYYVTDETTSEGLWQESWSGQTYQPRLVKIKIELENGGYWPEMIFELKSADLFTDSNGQTLTNEEQAAADAAALAEQDAADADALAEDDAP